MKNKILGSKFVLVILIMIVILVGYRIYSTSMEEYYSEFEVSASIAQSKEKGVFVKDVKILPVKLLYQDQEIIFNEAWIEMKSQIKYQYLITKKRIIKNYELFCFTLKQNSSTEKASDFLFVLEDDNKSIASRHINGTNVYYSDYGIRGKSEIKMSLIKNWEQARTKNITIKIDEHEL